MTTDAADQLERLYRTTGPDLLAFLHRRHGDSPVAEDLLHDTFMQALKKPERLAAAVSPRAYLFGVARNLSNEAFRRQRPTTDLPDELPMPAAEPPDARLEAMRAAIGALPAAQSEVLELRLQPELSYEEIAEVFNIPLGTVRSRLHQAVQRLRHVLNPPNGQPKPAYVTNR